MTVISGNTDCGNSPKMEFLREFNIAFAKGDIDFLTQHVAEDFTWEMIGKGKVEGKVDFKETLKLLADQQAIELGFEHILSHGKFGAIHGKMKMKSGEQYAFADFYNLANAKGDKIKKLTSFVIKEENKK